MSISTLFGYLFGNRQAILTLAGHPHTLVIGFLFVLSAGFAREYDGEDLLHDWWYLLAPVGASLAASLLLFLVYYIPGPSHAAPRPPFLATYRSFLGLFWMTAPLAWLYAIPYERFLGPVEATNANLATLALVSAWRVILMVRVGVVCFGVSTWAMVFRVMAFADTAALVALWFLPFPIIRIMGGMHLSEAEATAQAAAAHTLICGGCTLPFWWILVLATGFQPAWMAPVQKPKEPAPAPPIDPNVDWGMRAFVFLSLAVWLPILPFTQPEQQARREVDVAFREGRYADVLAILSAHEPDDFPPHWQPPPRYLKGESQMALMDIWLEINRHSPAPWVRALYLERFKGYLQRPNYDWSFHDDKIAGVLNELPEAEGLLREMAADENRVWWLKQLDEHLRPELRGLASPGKSKEPRTKYVALLSTYFVRGSSRQWTSAHSASTFAWNWSSSARRACKVAFSCRRFACSVSICRSWATNLSSSGL